MACKCDEGRTAIFNDYGRESGEKPTNLSAHDCAYIAQRNALIPYAESIADEKHPPDQTMVKERMKTTKEEAWAIEFFRAMET